MPRQYITTAIDYPNAAPHMGHVLEKVLADACARWMRLRGDEVRFQIGTDEHGVKIQQTADREKLTPKELVDRNVPLFQTLYDTLGISYDVFIRTTDKKKHWPTVEALWKKLDEAGALEQRDYEGLYCVGCERFITGKDLVDGKCAVHLKAPERIKEKNYFFLLAREGEWLKKILTDGTYTIVPDFRAPETLQLIEQGLEDVSFSRPKKSLAWGIPVPNDPEQTMYVWCDALTNYYSGVGGFVDSKESKKYWDEAEITHVIGKDIARFHALIWPAMLKNAGVKKMPDRLLIHGFITSEGHKMSKSLGNVVDPQEAIAKYGVDALRFFLLHEIPVGNDGDFSWKRFGEMYDAKLRNQLGNLLNRTLVLLHKVPFEGKLDDHSTTVTIDDPAKWVKDAWDFYSENMETFELHYAIAVGVMTAISNLNVTISLFAPWVEKDIKKRHSILTELAECLRHISLMLLPFIPTAAQEISRQLGVPYAEDMLGKDFVIKPEWKTWGGCKNWTKVGEPKILFPPVE